MGFNKPFKYLKAVLFLNVGDKCLPYILPKVHAMYYSSFKHHIVQETESNQQRAIFAHARATQKSQKL